MRLRRSRSAIRLTGAVLAALLISGFVYVVVLGGLSTSKPAAAPFPIGVIYGSRDQYANGRSGGDAASRSPAFIEDYYQPWLDGSGTPTRSSYQVTNTRIGVGEPNIAACGASHDNDPATCFESAHLSTWDPDQAAGWHGTLDISVAMIQLAKVPSPYTSRPALQAIKRNLDWGAYGTGTASAPGAFPYEANYRNLAKTLVSYGLGNSYILIAIEAEGYWYADQFGPDPAAWARFFDNIHDSMLSVQGARFRFVWTMGLMVGTTGLNGQRPPMTAAYPGDRDVNVVSIDWVDSNVGTISVKGRTQYFPYPEGDCLGKLPSACKLTVSDWENAWADWILPATNTRYSVYGLRWWSHFAESHHKQFALGAWGLQAGGDNWYLIREMWLWLNSLPHGTVAYATYGTDSGHSYWVDPHGGFTATILSPAVPGVSDGTVYTAAPCVYRKYFGGQAKLNCSSLESGAQSTAPGVSARKKGKHRHSHRHKKAKAEGSTTSTT